MNPNYIMLFLGSQWIATAREVTIEFDATRREFIDVTSLDSKAGYREFIQGFPSMPSWKILASNVEWREGFDPNDAFTSSIALICRIFTANDVVIESEVILSEVALNAMDAGISQDIVLTGRGQLGVTVSPEVDAMTRSARMIQEQVERQLFTGNNTISGNIADLPLMRPTTGMAAVTGWHVPNEFDSTLIINGRDEHTVFAPNIRTTERSTFPGREDFEPIEGGFKIIPEEFDPA